MRFSIYQNSLLGARKSNQDRSGYSYTRQSAMLVLADGMGGHPEGDTAAEFALNIFSHKFQHYAQPLLRQVQTFLTDALLSSHHRIIRYAADKGMLDTPRTTLVAAVIERNQCYLIHCGDSRLYWIRNGALLRRTRDHSLLEQALRANKPLANLQNRNTLYSCLGSTSTPQFDFDGPIDMVTGDRLVLCSDGFWAAFTDEAIATMLSEGPLDQQLESMMHIALQKGGATCDNITVLALDWEAQDDFDITHISTDDLAEGSFASTINPPSMADPPNSVLELDDATIERKIAEINEAIRRTANRKP